MKRNVIPRNFKRMTARQMTGSSGGAAGDYWIIYRDNGLHGVNLTTNKQYYIFADHLRVPELWQIVNIEK